MDNRGDYGGAVAIIGVACRFPGAADPAEYHDLTVAGRRMFRLVEGPEGTQAGRFVPRMREEEAAEASTTIRSV
jgi:hypothetical protein